MTAQRPRPRDVTPRDERPPFARELQRHRARRGWSQLHLALLAGVSPRHLSFLETGRAAPSREMALRLGAQLGITLRAQNELLAAAGFSPAHPQGALARCQQPNGGDDGQQGQPPQKDKFRPCLLYTSPSPRD